MPRVSYDRAYGSSQVYPTPGYQQSRDTVNTGDSSGSQSDQWNNSTAPSSDNSSFERPTPPVKQPQSDLGEQYGFTGFGAGPILEEYAGQDESNYSVSQQQNGYFQASHTGAPPPVPSKYNGHRVLSKHGNGRPVRMDSNPLGPSSGNAPNNRPAPPAKEEKRKSWFKRRFSKD
jgi:hypothetical protein